jgi:hypothetical protein
MTTTLLLVAGILLLTPSALAGFLQARAKEPATAARWRVVHAGGTAGAVQLLALAAVWSRFPPGGLALAVAVGIAASTWAFFVGPLARAVGKPRLASAVNLAGALVAGPAYLGLPLLLLLLRRGRP